MSSYFVHRNAICESQDIGNGTNIWAFTHILASAKIGIDCNICDHIFIENDVRIGDRVTIKSGVQLWDGVVVEDDVFIGPNVTFTNDNFPRSKVYPDKFLTTIVRAGASIGANATILPGLSIGTGAMVGAGAVVVRSVPSNAIVVGNPSRIIGYVDATKDELPLSIDSGKSTKQLSVAGVKSYNLTIARDLRGTLAALEFEDQVPFPVKRTFFVYDVPNKYTRGEHAHRRCHQFLVCIKGSCSLVVDNGSHRSEIVLDKPSIGIHIPPLIWGIQYNYSADAVLVVFASEHYNSEDYIREYSEFKEIVLPR